MKTARLFQSGGSQAVCLPREFRMPGTVVNVHREGLAVVLEPVAPKKWPVRFWSRIRVADASFVRPPQGAAQTRRPLDGEG